jgi:hypothetical protein
MRKKKNFTTEIHGRAQIKEVGSGTRRRPIGRDYAAAKDAELRTKGKINSTTECHGTARSGIYVNNPNLSVFICPLVP